MALGTPVAGAAAYSAAGGTTVAPAYPSGITAGDALVMFVGMKPSTANSGSVTTPSGWTLRDSLTGAGGYGTTLGADTGNTNLWVFTKDTVTGSETGTLSVTLGTNNVSWAFMVRVPDSGGTLSYGSADGQRTTTPTSPMSIALTNGATATNFQTGDLAIWAMCIPTDVTTPSQFSAQSITATGATFATAVELNEPDSTTGNDIGGYSAYASVSSGSSTAAPTVIVTLAGTLTNVRGPVVLLRLREGAAPQTLTPSLFTNGDTFHNPTVTPGAVGLTPALYTNTQTFYSPDVTQGGNAQDLTPALFTNTQTFYAAAVTATKTLTPALVTNDQTFYAPTVTTSVTLLPGLYSNSQTFYSPVVSQTGAPQSLLPSLYSNSQTFYAPTVDQASNTQTLTPSLFTNNQTFFAPTVTPGAIQLLPQGYAVDGYVDVGYYGPNTYSTQVFYTPQVIWDQTLSPGLLTNTSIFYPSSVDLLYPSPSDVRAGVRYGPGGIYVGTLTVTPGETTIGLRSFTGRF